MTLDWAPTLKLATVEMHSFHKLEVDTQLLPQALFSSYEPTSSLLLIYYTATQDESMMVSITVNAVIIFQNWQAAQTKWKKWENISVQRSFVIIISASVQLIIQIFFFLRSCMVGQTFM